MSAGVTLADDDAVELAEFLEVLHDWVAAAPELGPSLRAFLGCDGYTLAELRADLARFAFLLGGDGERLFGAER